MNQLIWASRTPTMAANLGTRALGLAVVRLCSLLSIVYAMAWGVSRGVLDVSTYLPVVRKGGTAS
jgi:hypothetical protein